jgi:hypothetical protein
LDRRDAMTHDSRTPKNNAAIEGELAGADYYHYERRCYQAEV